MTMTLTSPAFLHAGQIPRQHTGEGEDSSPELRWTEPPLATKELALLCVDPDAGESPWLHWVVYNIPAAARRLAAGLEKRAQPRVQSLTQGVNSWSRIGYAGPLPPPGDGPHHYLFTLYALDVALNLRPAATGQDLRRGMASHVLAVTTLVGLYERRLPRELGSRPGLEPRRHAGEGHGLTS